ncbi:ewing's tumor-associated antigen 1 [Pungitius pungitius]|uniref:ewing's tumor-associated antigen 1 n=1 Tax=Pungitius pungitius TaxID=134920 RepID=UPI002E137B20
MNRGRGTGSSLQRDSGPSKTNRLRRSFRPTQQTEAAKEGDSPRSQQPEFKTPTRIPRSRAGSGFTAESPNNDSDFQQDIIWDATSPSPSRLGKRGVKQKPPGAVDISDIVSRIAPKYGRPTVAEPTLQQWIGDSAAIPCTPDVQGPRPKKKSPRPNGVDDLLKLAKQFDFNMFHRDEEEAEEMHQQSLELLSEDILSGASPALPEGRRRPDPHVEDELDFLFDGPTQRFSGNLSQLTQVKPPAQGAPGTPAASSHDPGAGVSGAGANAALARDEFEDDWENDDLLNDSLVLEMTQNPQKFCAPQHCSTQIAAGHVTHRRESPAGAVARAPVSNNGRQRTTFKLETNPVFSLGGIQKNGKVDFASKESVKDAAQSGRCPGNGVSVEAGSRSWQTPNPVKSYPRQAEIHRRASVARYDAAASNAASNASSTQTGRSFPTEPAPVASRGVASRGEAAASDLLQEDLEELFSSDPVWGDEDDDDLLCEMCEVVENRLQGAENVPAGGAPPPGGHVTDQRAPLPPSNGSQQPAHRRPFDPKTQTAGEPAVGSWTAGSASITAAGVRVTDSSQAKSASACGSAWTHGSSRGNAGEGRFTFKKPGGPVATATVKDLSACLPSAAGGSCSAAEIERKKQQAKERRRQRTQAAQNLRAAT